MYLTDMVTAWTPVQVAALVFALGLLFGSFAVAAALRLRRSESIVWPRSYCPACRHSLAWYDLIPVFSFLLLRGRCRYCRVTVWSGYAVCEAACGTAAAAAAYVGALWRGPLWGLSAGGILLAVWTVSAVLIGLTMRTDQSGLSLVEVLVASALLAGVAAGAFHAMVVSQRAAVSVPQHTAALGWARDALAIAGVQAITGAPSSGTREQGAYRVTTAVEPRTDLTHPTTGDPLCWWVQVTVTCPGCGPGGSGPADVRLSEVVCR